jgi:hypothetical protein
MKYISILDYDYFPNYFCHEVFNPSLIVNVDYFCLCYYFKLFQIASWLENEHWQTTISMCAALHECITWWLSSLKCQCSLLMNIHVLWLTMYITFGPLSTSWHAINFATLDSFLIVVIFHLGVIYGHELVEKRSLCLRGFPRWFVF